LRDLIDRSVSEVRLTAGIYRKERIRVADFIEETEVHASLEAASRNLHFSAGAWTLRYTLMSTGSSSVRNRQSPSERFKFTRPLSHIRLRTMHHTDCVLIEIEDECGGLPRARPKRSSSRSSRGDQSLGLGWDLRSAAGPSKRMAARFGARHPRSGCVFVIEMPLPYDPIGTSKGSSREV
jgi:hypothetical protein